MTIFKVVPRSKDVDEALNKNEIYKQYEKAIHVFENEKEVDKYIKSAKKDKFFNSLGKNKYFAIYKTDNVSNLSDMCDWTLVKKVDF